MAGYRRSSSIALNVTRLDAATMGGMRIYKVYYTLYNEYMRASKIYYTLYDECLRIIV